MSELNINHAIAIKNNAYDLNLDLFTSVSDDASQFLISNKIFPNLKKLEDISEQTARLLYYGYDYLNLNYISNLSPSIARILIDGENSNDKNNFNLTKERSLLLDGLVEFSVELAEVICNFKGNLSLNGLTQISERESDFLSKHNGILHLNKIQLLTEDSCKMIANHKGILYLKGLGQTSPKGTEYLMANSNICFNAYSVKLGGGMFKWPAPENSEYLNGLAADERQIYYVLYRTTLDANWLEKRICSLAKGSNFLIERCEEMHKLQYNLESIQIGIEHINYWMLDLPDSSVLIKQNSCGSPSKFEILTEKIHSLQYQFEYLQSLRLEKLREMMEQ